MLQHFDLSNSWTFVWWYLPFMYLPMCIVEYETCHCHPINPKNCSDPPKTLPKNSWIRPWSLTNAASTWHTHTCLSSAAALPRGGVGVGARAGRGGRAGDPQRVGRGAPALGAAPAAQQAGLRLSSVLVATAAKVCYGFFIIFFVPTFCNFLLCPYVVVRNILILSCLNFSRGQNGYFHFLIPTRGSFATIFWLVSI